MKSGACCALPPTLKRRGTGPRAGRRCSLATGQQKAPRARPKEDRRRDEVARRRGGRRSPPQCLVAGAGALLEGGVGGVVAGGWVCREVGAVGGVFSEVVVVGDVPLL